jgi:hypothetical protein
VYGISSEPHSLASEAEEAWNTSIPIVGDPHHEVRKDLKARGWLDVFYNENDGHLDDRNWASHPNGYYQPAVIAVDKTGRILYRWRLVPKRSNMNGAGARPESGYIWERMKQAMSSKGDAKLDKKPVMTEKDPPWILALLMFLANGWFIQPKAFPMSRDGKEGGFAAVRKAQYRLGVFLLAWVMALIFLPFKWVGIGGLVWLAIITPGVRKLNSQFQTVKDPD